MSFLFFIDTVVLDLFGRATSWIQSKTGWNNFAVAKLLVGLFAIAVMVSAWNDPLMLVIGLGLIVLLVSDIVDGVRETSDDGYGHRVNPGAASPKRKLFRCIFLMITLIGCMSLERMFESSSTVEQLEVVAQVVRMILMTSVLYLSACTPEPRASLVRRHIFCD